MTAIPHAKDSPPWSGPAHLLRDGRLYAFPAARGSLALYFDRDQNHHAATCFDGSAVGSEYVWCGRRFDVVRMEDHIDGDPRNNDPANLRIVVERRRTHRTVCIHCGEQLVTGPWGFTDCPACNPNPARE